VVSALAQRLRSESARPRRIANWPHAHWLAVAAVCLGAFMGQLDASVVTLTFPALSSEFGASLAAVEWVSLSYLLTLVALLAPVGRLADAAGRKLVYLYGFGVFTLASVACGLADSLPMLIGFRVLQAVGAAMLQANSVALITTSAPRHRMRAALGVQAAAQAVDWRSVRQSAACWWPVSVGVGCSASTCRSVWPHWSRAVPAAPNQAP